MTTVFPGALDSFTNPVSTDPLNSGTVPHASQHANVNDAISALEKLLVGNFVFNVKAYGAVGNGVTDDITAIAAAITAAKAAGGGVIFFPPGTYLVSNHVVVDASNIVLKGAGRQISRILLKTNTSLAVVCIGAGSSPTPAQTITHVGVEDLGIDGNMSYVNQGLVSSATTTTLTDSTASFGSYSGGLYYVGIAYGTDRYECRAITSSTSTTLTVASAWTVTPDTTSTYIVVKGQDPSRPTYTGYESASERAGIGLFGVEYGWVQRCLVQGVPNSGIDILRSGDILIADNVILNTTLLIPGGPKNAIQTFNVFGGSSPDQTRSRRTIIRNNVVRYFSDTAISLTGQGSDTALISGNHISDAFSNSSSPADMIGAGGTAINVEVESSDTYDNTSNVIEGNVIRTCWSGISVGRSGTPMYHRGIVVANNVVSEVNDSGIEICGHQVSVTGNTVYRWGLVDSVGGSRGISVKTTNVASGTEDFRDITVSGNTVYTNSALTSNAIAGIYISAGNLSTIDGITVSGNTVDGPGTTNSSGNAQFTIGIWLRGAIGNANITGNTIRRFYYGIQVGDTSSTTYQTKARAGTVISGNQVSQNNHDGIRITDAATKLVIAGNVCNDNGQVASGDRAGIHLVSASYCQLVGNVCGNTASGTTQQQGILIDTGCTSNRIDGGNLRDNTTAALTDSGTTTVKTVATSGSATYQT